MKIYEVTAARTKPVLDVQPASVTKQRRVATVVDQLASNDQQARPPTQSEVIQGVLRYGTLKRQAERRYANSLRQQLAAVQIPRN